MKQRRRARELALALDLLPLRHEAVELALEHFRRHILADRPDDDSAGLVGQNARDLLLQPLPFGAGADLAADADLGRIRDVDQETAGERNLGGDARTLVEIGSLEI